MTYSAALLSPGALQIGAAMSGLPSPLSASFNVCISNVPGPSEPLYWRGARLQASYPVSIPVHSMALNITAHSYAGTLAVGFVGDREALPAQFKNFLAINLPRVAPFASVGTCIGCLLHRVLSDRHKRKVNMVNVFPRSPIYVFFIPTLFSCVSIKKDSPTFTTLTPTSLNAVFWG